MSAFVLFSDNNSRFWKSVAQYNYKARQNANVIFDEPMNFNSGAHYFAKQYCFYTGIKSTIYNVIFPKCHEKLVGWIIQDFEEYFITNENKVDIGMLILESAVL